MTEPSSNPIQAGDVANPAIVAEQKPPPVRKKAAAPGPHRYAVFLITAMGIMSFGMTEAGPRGWVFLAMAACMLILPVRGNLGKGLNLVLLGILGLGLFSFLPNNILPTPEWRNILEGSYGVDLGVLHSPQPWVSLESLISLIVGLAWFSYLHRRRWQDADRRFLMRALAIFLSGLGLMALICKYNRIFVQWWGWEIDTEGNWHQFGPFSNLNHMGTVLAIGAVLCASCAYDDNRRRRPTWLLYVACLLVTLFSIVVCDSKGGLVLFFIGLGLWVGLTSFSTKSPKVIGIATSVLVLLAAGLFVFSRKLLSQFEGGSEMGGVGGRLDIWSNTLSILMKHPIAGVGLGNFEGVFAMNRTAEANLDRVLHPESSWLWAGVEMGFLVYLLAGIGFFILYRRIGFFVKAPKARRYQHRLRVGAAIGAALLVIHSLFDIPGHIFGTVLLASLMSSLATRPLITEPSRVQRLSTPLGALLVAIAGAVLVAQSYFGVLLPGAIGAKHEYAASITASGSDTEAALGHAETSVRWKPLQWEHHLQRGMLAYANRRDSKETLNDFRAALYLEQKNPAIPMKQAKFWLHYDPPLAAWAWRNLLDRDPLRQKENYDSMLKAASRSPALETKVRELGQVYPRLRVMYLGQVDSEEFQRELSQILENDPELLTITGPDRKKLFLYWQRKGDKAQLIQALEDRPEWMEEGWETAVRIKAEKKQFSAALDLASRYHTPPRMPIYTGQALSPEALEREMVLNPTDVGRAIAAFDAQINAGDKDGAFLTVRKIERLPDTQKYVFFLKAQALGELGKYEDAWNALETHFRINRR